MTGNTASATASPFPILIGYRATGKTTVAMALAGQFGCQSLDADDAFEQQTGCSIAQFISDKGEPAFREAETSVLCDLLSRPETILATGGGVVLREENRRLIRQAARPVIWLTAPAAEIRRRLAADPSTAARRPALAGGSVLDEVGQALADREPAYREVADVSFDTTTCATSALVAAIGAWLAGWQPAATAGQPLRGAGE